VRDVIKGTSPIFRDWFQVLKSWFRRDWWVWLIFFLAAGLAMYPVLADFNARLVGPLGDNVQYVYITGRVAEALRSGESIFSDPQLNYPDGLLLAATDVPFLSMVVAAPWTTLFGPVSGYNLIILASHVLSGYFAYLWILRLTNSRLAGVVAGLSFLLAPFRIAHSYGHLQLVSTQFLPLFFWALDSLLQAPKPQGRKLVLLTLSTFVVGFSSQYYLAITLLSGGVYTVLSVPRWKYLLLDGWKILLSVAAGALLSSIPYFQVSTSQGIYSPYDTEKIRLWSNSLLDFVMPPYTHALWGELMTGLYSRVDWVEHSAYLGIVALALAAAALIIKGHPNRRRTLTWLGVALFALVMALGTDIWIQNNPLQAEDPFWLPAAYLGRVPGLGLIRVWARFSIILILFVSLLAGVGAAVLRDRFEWSPLVILLLVGLVVVDLLPGNLQSAALYPRAIDAWLARQLVGYPTAFLQSGTEHYKTMYGSLFHDMQIPAYNHPIHRPPAYQEFREMSADFPSLESIRRLEDHGFRYLVLQHRWFQDGWSEVEETVTAAPGLEIIADEGGFVVVEIKK
jgi:hypothetical protein